VKVGTVVVNPWASDKNPLKKSVYIGSENNMCKVISMNFGHVTKYHKEDFKKFEIIGMAEIKTTKEALE